MAVGGNSRKGAAALPGDGRDKYGVLRQLDASVTLTVSAAFVPGDYLIKLVGSGGQQSYVPLTVWDPSSTATYVVQNDVLTWQAWNSYGGYDYYQGPGQCPARNTRCAPGREWCPSTAPMPPRKGQGNS